MLEKNLENQKSTYDKNDGTCTETKTKKSEIIENKTETESKAETESKTEIQSKAETESKVETKTETENKKTP